jgi:hypothetical protein
MIAFLRLFRKLKWFLPSMAVIRLSAFLTFAFLCLSFAFGRVLYADVKEAAMAAGHELLGLGDLTHDAETVWFNGARFHHASLTVKQGASEVLDRIEAHCEQAPNVVGRIMLELPESELAKVIKEKPTKAFRHLVFREDSKDGARGAVICLVDDEQYSVEGAQERLKRFNETQDFTVFGKLRYAYAEKLESGSTQVVTLWADSGLDLRKMFPPTGDAAGDDSAVLPRPPRSRRTLSGNAEELPYSVRLYDTPETVEAVGRFYDSWMKSHGFEKSALKDADAHGAGYTRPDGYQAFVALSSRDGKTSIAVSEAGRDDGTSTAIIGVEEE